MVWLRSLPLALLLVLQAPQFATAQSSDATWSIDDIAGDQTFSYLTNVNTPAPDASGTSKHVDLRKVTIGGETEVGFAIDVYVEDLVVDGSGSRPWESCFPPADWIEIKFTLQVSPPVHYRVLVFLYASGTPATGSFRLGLTGGCLTPDGQWEAAQRIDVSVSDQENRIRAWVPKASLTGQEPLRYSRGGTWPASVPQDTRIDNVIVNATGHGTGSTTTGFASLLPASFDTAAAPATKSFSLRAPPANQVIKAAFESSGRTLTVVPGLNQSMPFTIMNAGTARRLITIEYRLTGSDAAVALYRATGPGSAIVPAGEVRKFIAAVAVDPSAAHGQNVTFAIRAVAAGNANEVAYAELLLAPGPALGPDRNTLYTHTRSAGYACIQLYTYPCGVIPFLSPLENDPAALKTNWPLYYSVKSDGSFEGKSYARTSGEGAALPILVNTTRPLHAEFLLSGTADVADVTLGIEVGAGNGTSDYRHVLYRGQKTLDVTTTGTKFSYDLGFVGAYSRLARGTGFEVRLFMTTPGSPGAAAGYGRGGFLIEETKSFLRFPFDELAASDLPTISPGMFRLDLVEADATDGFLNKGEARLFNLTLYHQGVSPARAQLAAGVDAKGWATRIRPAAAYDLQPGDSIRIGFFVFAPADANVDDRAQALINVTDPAGLVSSLPVKLLVTEIPQADDSIGFVDPPEAKEKAVPEKVHDSPAASTLGMIVATAGAALATAGSRRRRNVS